MSTPEAQSALPEIPEQGEANALLSLAGGLVIFTVQGIAQYRAILAEVGLPASRLSKVKSRQDLRALHIAIADLRTRQAAQQLQARLGHGRLDPLYVQAGKLLLRGKLRQGLRLLTQPVPGPEKGAPALGPSRK